MSLITRCPGCTTTFKVVRDQLRVSDGWVRCGHCGEAFDASAYLQSVGQTVTGYMSDLQVTEPEEPRAPIDLDVPELVSDEVEVDGPVDSAASSYKLPKLDDFDFSALTPPLDPHRQAPPVREVPKPEPEPVLPPQEPAQAGSSQQEAEAVSAPGGNAVAAENAKPTEPDPTQEGQPTLPETETEAETQTGFEAVLSQALEPAQTVPQQTQRHEPMLDPVLETDESGRPSDDFSLEPITAPDALDVAPVEAIPSPLHESFAQDLALASAAVASFSQAVQMAEPEAGSLGVDKMADAPEPEPESLRPAAAPVQTGDVVPAVAAVPKMDGMARRVSAPAQPLPLEQPEPLPSHGAQWADTTLAAPLQLPVHPPAPAAQPRKDAKLSFLKTPARQGKAPWARPLWASLAVVLTLTLTGQYLVQDRDRLVAYVPSLRPAINAACGLFQCRIKPWRQIEQITIEGSAFSKVRSDLFRLNLTLHNAATVPLAAPAVELTLTDAMDQVLVRRVLQPEELGAVEGVLTVGSDYQSSLLLNVTSGILADRIVGYRLLAFYP